MQSTPAGSSPVIARPLDDSTHSGVSWAAVFAGAAAAASLSYLMIVLGFGLGMSSVSPYSGSGASATTVGIATIVWLALTQIISAGMGGYLAGRLRSKWLAVHADEVYFRDTAHGFLSWAVASLVVASFLASSIAGVVSGGASVASSAVGGAASAASSMVSKSADLASENSHYFVDSLFRSAQPAPGQAVTSSDTSNAEAARIMARDLADGSVSPADKQYLSQLIAQRTGISQSEAEQRVDSVFNSMKQSVETAKAKAKEAADLARKAAAGLALWLFVSLLCGAFSGSFFAAIGGRRRDSDAVLLRSNNRPI